MEVTLVSLVFVKFIVILGVGCWLFIAAIGNLLDPETQHYSLYNMMTMVEISNDPVPKGKKLLSRSVDNKGLVVVLVKLIAVYQIIVSLLFIVSAFLLLFSTFFHSALAPASVSLADFSIGLFCALWLFFLCGGWWFAYWIKLPTAQAVHFALIGLGILIFIMLHCV